MAKSAETQTAEDTREMVCIVCPIGCRLKVDLFPPENPEKDDTPQVKVTGNKCPRGEAYAREEVLAPKRTVTATCRIEGAAYTRRIPVKTTAALPVEHIDDLLRHLYGLRLQVPVSLGDTIVDDVAGTGIKVVASRSVE